ncbi:hypothetical protein BH23PLA1_BH23PLA1_07640 [soil metagenome]
MRPWDESKIPSTSWPPAVWRSRRVGQKIAVRYPPGQPGLAIINRDLRMFYLLQIVFLTFSAMAVAIALLLLAAR